MRHFVVMRSEIFRPFYTLTGAIVHFYVYPSISCMWVLFFYFHLPTIKTNYVTHPKERKVSETRDAEEHTPKSIQTSREHSVTGSADGGDKRTRAKFSVEQEGRNGWRTIGICDKEAEIEVSRPEPEIEFPIPEPEITVELRAVEVKKRKL